MASAGLKLKLPFVQTVNGIDSRILGQDGNASDMTTMVKHHISADFLGRRTITEPLQYFLRLSDERSTQSRLADM
jgi:membrane protease subunit HflC